MTLVESSIPPERSGTMWTIRTIIRYFDTCTGESIELVVEQYVALALQELFGTVFVGAVAVTYPLSRGRCMTILPATISVIMHCPDKHNEVVPDSSESTGLLTEQCISLALEKHLDHILLDMVTVSYCPYEDRWHIDTCKW
jgi:hypothetical protein